MISIQNHEAYKFGVLCAKQGDFNEALDQFKEILSVHPHAVLDVLIPLYRQVALYPDNFELRAFIADLCIMGRLYSDAFVELEELFRMSPDFPKTYFLLGKLYKKKQNPSKVKDLLEEAFQIGILDSTVLDLLPGIYLEENNIHKSIHIYEKLVQERPTVLHYAKTLADLYEQAGRFEEAATQYEILVDRSPVCITEAVEFCEKLMKYCPTSFLIRKIAIKFNMKACNPMQAIGQIQALMVLDSNYIHEAIPTYKHILDLYPDTPDVLLELAKVLIQVDRYSEAVTCLRHVFAHEAYNEALLISYLELILSKYPNQHMALQLLIELACKSEKYSQVLTYISGMIDLNVYEETPVESILNAMLEKDPQNRRAALYQLQRYYYNQQAHAKSLEMGDRVNQLGVVVESVVLQAKTYEQLGDCEFSISLLQKTLKLRPFDRRLHGALKESFDVHLALTIQRSKHDLSFSELKRGVLNLAQGNLELASECFQKALPESEDYVEAQLFSNRCFAQMGRLDLAIHQGKAIIDGTPAQSEHAKAIRYVVGIQLIQAGQVSEGVSLLENILQYDIHFPFVQHVLTHFQKESLFDLRGKLLSGCFDQPGGLYCPVTFRNRETGTSKGAQTMSFAQSHNNQGVDFALKGQYQSAKESFELALALDPDLHASYCNLAMVAMAQNQKEQAQVFLDQAGNLNKKWDVVFLNKGLCALQNKQFEVALDFCKSARALNPDNPFIKLSLGDIYYQLGDLKLAFLYWSQAASSGMVYPYLQRRIGYLMPDFLNQNFLSQLFLKIPAEFLEE